MLTVRRVPRNRVALPSALSSLETVVALALAHVAAGGEVPDIAWLTAFGVLVYGAGLAVLRRRASIRLALPALLSAQVLGHAWLVALTPGTHASHGHGTDTFLGLTPSMVAAHVMAAAVTGVVWALRRRAVAVLLRWQDPGRLPAPVWRRTLAPLAEHRRPPLRAAFEVAPTRGPPAALLAT